MKIRHVLTQSVTFLVMVVALLVLVPEGLMLVTGVKAPAMAVLSESMEPGIKKGDMVFVHNKSNQPFHVGEIILFKVDGFELPVVHRVIEVHKHPDTGEIQVLTKGDNNSVDDRFLYPIGQQWLQPHDIIGRVAGHLSYVGWPSVFISEAYMMLPNGRSTTTPEIHLVTM
ncbi:signal peptidase complex catalytic subunit SEC11A-like [Hordeum vulgare subsp. vulgare]|uniref:signal peptidase I n=1 Tax=Hordeum vulgare subsp. vulgare TaxID=112509 RepID=A0A8I6XXU4_HORVV|nr:signal peptidase complex catalytic subunit SEC11A-like [Hordeum vulgare subsp. vulgare]